MSTEGLAPVAQTADKRVSLVAKFAARFSVDPAKMMATLKATAFKVKDGNVSDEQMMALMIVADQYGLNPFTKEIYAFPDKGGIVPVVGVDGWARIINENQHFDGMTFDMPDDGSECTCTIFRKDRSHPIAVTEYLAECKRNVQPWQTHPRRMLRHKAMIQCARLAFGYVGIYDQDEAERIVEGEVIERDFVGKPKVNAPKTKKAMAAEASAPAPAPADELTDAEKDAAARANAAAFFGEDVPQ